MTEFITIGEPLVVLASTDIDVELQNVKNFKKYLAGAELNVAIGLSRLGHDVTYLSKIGNDPFGDFILNAANEAEIDTKELLIDANHSTGFYLKQSVTHGDPEVAYFRKHSAASNLRESDILNLDLRDTKLAHLSGIFPALSRTALQTFKAFNKRLNDAKIMTIFDPNLRPALWESKEQMIQITNELAKNSQIVLPGINEGEVLMGERDPEKIADFYLNQSELTQCVVVKLGDKGAFFKTKNKNGKFIDGFKVEHVVDTVGAGDGFAVGLESALLEEWSLEEAVKRACAVGACAVLSAGDNDGYPTREQLVEFINKNTDRGRFAC